MEPNVAIVKSNEGLLLKMASTDLSMQQRNALENRSFELLHKFRKTWNEAEYQEWCAIQRILHKIG